MKGKRTEHLKNIFDFNKRVNQRAVNKRTLESLAYAGAFECFPEHHRAQFFIPIPEDQTTGLEKIIRFGQVYSKTTCQQQIHCLVICH
jgi:DNA polymerase-3 subunit alpha